MRECVNIIHFYVLYSHHLNGTALKRYQKSHKETFFLLIFAKIKIKGEQSLDIASKNRNRDKKQFYSSLEQRGKFSSNEIFILFQTHTRIFLSFLNNMK
jgi:hypothetical protein